MIASWNSATTTDTYLAPSWANWSDETGSCTTWGQYTRLPAVYVREAKIEKGKSYKLPDGSTLIVDPQGNYRIDDREAQVVYQANRLREFSPHLNASDLVADFVSYVGGLGLEPAEILKLPLHLFVSWLIIAAAERDGDPLPAEVQPVASHPRLRQVRRPRCRHCGRFIPRRYLQHDFAFCNPQHAERHLS